MWGTSKALDSHAAIHFQRPLSQTALRARTAVGKQFHCVFPDRTALAVDGGRPAPLEISSGTVIYFSEVEVYTRRCKTSFTHGDDLMFTYSARPRWAGFLTDLQWMFSE